MTEAGALRKAQYEAFQKQTGDELMKLVQDAETVAKREPLFAKYSHDLYRIKNSLLLDLQKLNER